MLSPDRPRLAATLVERLSARADRLRKLEVRLGARPWRVFVRLYRWTGAEKWHGTREMVREIELTPAPIVRDEGSLRNAILSGGARPEGTVRLAEISPRYTEADLDILTAPLQATEEVTIEIVHDARDGADPMVRSFSPAAKPERDVLGLQWTLPLTLTQEQRSSEVAR